MTNKSKRVHVGPYTFVNRMAKPGRFYEDTFVLPGGSYIGRAQLEAWAERKGWFVREERA